jgi:hypothetical protein
MCSVTLPEGIRFHASSESWIPVLQLHRLDGNTNLAYLDDSIANDTSSFSTDRTLAMSTTPKPRRDKAMT